MQTTHVPGSYHAGKVLLFALSTCGWCRKARKLLEDNRVEYDYIYVDLLQRAERDEALAEMGKHTSQRGFPTAVINGQVIVGYDEAKMRRALGL